MATTGRRDEARRRAARKPDPGPDRETSVLAERARRDAPAVTPADAPDAPDAPDALAVTAETAFAGRYPHLYRHAYRVAFRLLGARPDADDLAQEACARAYARWKRVASMDSPEAWVTRVAANLAVDTWRKKANAARKLGGTRAIVDLAAAESDASADRVDLHRALDRLPRRQREVVLLRYVADLSEAQVAAALRCAPGTVKSHAARGLEALRAVLAPKER